MKLFIQISLVHKKSCCEYFQLVSTVRSELLVSGCG